MADATDNDLMILVAIDERTTPVASVTQLPGGESDTGAVHVFVVGQLCEAGCDAVADTVFALAEHATTMTIDLSEVHLLDAAGFSMLLSLDRHLTASDGQLVLTNLSPEAARVLDILGWAEVRHAINHRPPRPAPLRCGSTRRNTP